MENKLSYTLRSFSKYELNQFRKYILSPFFNENEQLIELYDALLPYLKKQKVIDLDKEDLWLKLYPQKKYNDTRFRRLNSDLLKLAEDFIAYKQYQKNPVVPQLFLIKAIGEHNLPKLQNTNFKQASQLQEKNVYRNAEYYYNEFILQNQKANVKIKKFERNEKIDVSPIFNNLDYFYIAEKLKFYCEVLNYKEFFQIDYEPPYMNQIFQQLEQLDYENIPAIAMYYRIFLCWTEEENEAHYHQLGELLQKHSEKFPQEEAYMIYSFAQNYCIKKINTGRQEYLREIFKLYQTGLHKRVIFVNGKLSPWDYKNIVTVGIRLKEFEWTEDFINDYKTHLPLEFRENAYTFNLANLYFNQQNYDKVISLLLTVEYQDVFYLLDSKSMLLKTYYETQEDEALYALLDSFKILLMRKKVVSPQIRTNYLNLIKHTKKLLDLRNGKSHDINTIKAELNTDSNIADIGWLKEKIEEIPLNVE